jgi:hypothetical protein
MTAIIYFGEMLVASLLATVLYRAQDSGASESDIAPRPKSANRRQSWESASSTSGIVRPSAFAVFRLMTSSNLALHSCERRRAGFGEPHVTCRRVHWRAGRFWQKFEIPKVSG